MRNRTHRAAAPLCPCAEEEKRPTPSREQYGEKLISRPEFPVEQRDTIRRARGPSVWSGERARGAAQISSPPLLPHSNLLHKSRDIGKRVSRFLCNEFAVRGEGKEGSKSRGEARLISPFTSGVFAETAGRRHFPHALLVARLYSA